MSMSMDDERRQIGVLGNKIITISKEHGLVFEPGKKYIVGKSLYSYLKHDFPDVIVNLSYNTIAISISFAFSKE